MTLYYDKRVELVIFINVITRGTIMSSKRKKLKLEQEGEEEHLSLQEEEEEEGSSSDDSSSVESDLEIQVEFEGTEIKETDYHGIRRLLQQLFLKAPVDVSSLSSYIVQQKNIGSLIKTCNNEEDEESVKGVESGEESGDDNVYGITTLVQLPQDKSGLYEYLMNACSTSKLAQKIKELSADPQYLIGVVLHERFLNIPPDIGPPVLNCLIDEVEANISKITHFIVITRSHSLTDSESSSKRKGQKNKSKTNNIIYDFPEMEYFKKESLFEHNYSVSSDHDTVQGGRWSFDDEVFSPHRSVLLLNKESFYKAFRQLTSDFNK
ncbi:PREDICTED: BRCA2 and CDKN1A-interacting protein-like isoform X1 [Amphimedon queenslandica]|uniref:Protein BCCIP homolog n=2 Tax=Amphimedon queenslandica TaxID=400682 RepID=A0A1X7VMY0_AMPQE|nr:PREDICTED: BRCA2 and CDKN1A-interacting protein-like isoform X1 [Amphimedon queenslandica]|eukprot:XP_019864432.1 PREDICTED: BRCA2 and CDKN1A-interacting protein-like isoform X1 [Amphimedon queenslandica]